MLFEFYSGRRSKQEFPQIIPGRKPDPFLEEDDIAVFTNRDALLFLLDNELPVGIAAPNRSKIVREQVSQRVSIE